MHGFMNVKGRDKLEDLGDEEEGIIKVDLYGVGRES
jgi:hypothetical protein